MLKILRYALLTLIVTVGLPLSVWASGFIIFCGTMSSMMQPLNPDHMDAAIVLTGGTNRVEKGLDLLSSGTVSYLLVSGVHKDVTLPALISQSGYKGRIDKSRITLGREAGNTIGNARESFDWVTQNNIHDAYVVTSTYHMARALLEFRHVLPAARLVPYPVEPVDFSPTKRIYWKTAFVEYHKLLVTVYRVLLYPNETQPIPPSLSSQ